MSTFDPEECVIKEEFWCGEGEKDGVRTGTPHECMRRGFGAGMHSEREKHLPPKSLQRIKYVGEEYEKRFKASKIKNTDDLRKFIGKATVDAIRKKLQTIFTKSSGGLDKRAYNSTLLWLYHNGKDKLPRCSK